MSRLRAMLTKHAPIVAFVLVCVFMSALTASAQTNTPVPPTAVPPTAIPPVQLTVDTNQLFTSANNWISNLMPVLAIGIGITIAIAILTFVGAQIIKAFKNPGGSAR